MNPCPARQHARFLEIEPLTPKDKSGITQKFNRPKYIDNLAYGLPRVIVRYCRRFSKANRESRKGGGFTTK
jgi:hypothetical protein